MKRLRLVKVIVQPVFVLDDGESLEEVTAQPLPVTAQDWPTFATDTFPQMAAQVEAQVCGAAQPNPGGEGD